MTIEHLTADASPERLRALERAFVELHASLRADGYQAELVEGGANLWLQGQLPMLGRITTIACAWQGDNLQGFAAGSIRVAPAYVGGTRSGAVTLIHVEPAVRRTGLGLALFGSLEDWFRAREVAGIELEVLPGNAGGLAFWERLGFRTVHFAMRRSLD
jgi:ribosomal protein S18 acetylase RimI-like enzyme